MNMPTTTLKSNLNANKSFIKVTAPADLKNCFGDLQEPTDAIHHVSLSSVFSTAPNKDEFTVCLTKLNMNKVTVGKAYSITVLDYDGYKKRATNKNSSKLTVKAAEQLNTNEMLFNVELA